MMARLLMARYRIWRWYWWWQVADLTSRAGARLADASEWAIRKAHHPG